ncbi:MAG: 4Fe-4S dicluster domain-containing protein [archaeon]
MSDGKVVSETKSKAVTMDDFDSSFKTELSKIAGVENLKFCYQCGTCTADCPIARVSKEFRPRSIMHMAQLGMKERIFEDEKIWLCAACFTCVDHCPQGVDIAGVLRALRNQAVKEGKIPKTFVAIKNNIHKSGLAYNIPDIRKRKRVENGLPELPEANADEISRLLNFVAKSKEPKTESN